MAKGKSSASTATRKKHARKAAGKDGDVAAAMPPKDKKQKGKGKKAVEPRKKMYVAPYKPPPVQQDPLDSLGIAHQLPGDLVVILRKLGKKDEVTKGKALEELQAEWVGRAREGSEADEDALATMLPVWLHHVPTIFLHPSRRVRYLAITIHAKLLHIARVHERYLFQLREVSSTDEVENVLGSWCMIAHDADRQVSISARRSLAEHVSLSPMENKFEVTESTRKSLIAFVQRAILDPLGLYLYLNPVQAPVNTTPPKIVRGKPVPVPPTRKVEEPEPRSVDEESDEDRKARLRIGGLGVLRWLLDSYAQTGGAQSLEDLLEILSNPALWTGLYPFSEDPESFGIGQPLVRSATWRLIHALLQNWKTDIQAFLTTLSVAVLRSAFVEPDAQVRSTLLAPWLTFLKEFPNAWIIEASYGGDEDEDEDDSDEELANGDEKKIARSKRSTAFQAFLQFLELGCGGAPVQGYPTVIIIISTIPSSIIAQADADAYPPYPGHAFFTSFWAAIDGRALTSTLDRLSASAAFLSALLECVGFIVHRLRSQTQGSLFMQGVESADGEQAARALVRDQYARVWEEMAGARLKVDGAKGTAAVVKGLEALEAEDRELFSEAWGAFVPALAVQAQKANDGQVMALRLAKTFRDSFVEGSEPRSVATDLVQSIATTVISNARAALTAEDSDDELNGHVGALLNLIHIFEDILFDNSQLVQSLHEIVQGSLYKLAGVSPALIVTFTSRTTDHQLWQNVLGAISARPALTYSALPVLVDAAERGALSAELRPSEQALDAAMAKLFEDAAEGGNAAALLLLLRVVRQYVHFLSLSSFETLLQLVVSDVGEQCSSLLSSGTGSVARLQALLDIVAAALAVRPSSMDQTWLTPSLLPNVFLVAQLFPTCFRGEEAAPSIAIADRVWAAWIGLADETAKREVAAVIQRRLCELICSVTALPTPHDIHLVVSKAEMPVRMDMAAALPDDAYLDDLAATLNQDPAHPSLAVLLPLIPPPSSFDVAESIELPTDGAGFSAYARAVFAWMLAAYEDRQMLRTETWVLRHLIILGVLAEEFVFVPALQSPVFGDTVDQDTLLDIMVRVQQLAAYLLSVPSDERWHADVTRVAAGGKAAKTLDAVGLFVAELVRAAQAEDTYRDSRVVHDVLLYILGDVSPAEADLWMDLARKLETKAKQISLAIVQAVARSGAEPPRLNRYRNELAADVLGVAAAQVNDKGLTLLRRLTASAPDPDSDVPFLPQQRAVNFMRACNQWLTSDEDTDEDVESELMLVFAYLVPILQNVTGSHWELMLDIVENSFENSTFDDDLTLTGLWRAIKLAETIQEFATYNKTLRESWNARKPALLVLVKDIIASEKSSVTVMDSEPRSACREAALTLLQNMPSSLLDHETLPKMIHLLSNPSTTVLKISHELLREAAKKYTEHLVIEAGVDLDSTVMAELPVELVSFLQQTIDLVEPASEKGSTIFALLLGWMVFLDLFEDTSIKVKSGYVEQLTFLDIVATHLLPTISALLNIGSNGKPFKLDFWMVDDFYVPDADPDDFTSLRLFAAHIYYRALITIPSLVRNWLTTYNDRGTQSTVAAYTSTYFSAPIISSELSRIRHAEKSDLEAENFAIKLAAAVREVSAIYNVDDQQLEFTLKIPPNWPLQRIELRDSKLVGVSESRWRGWLLGVQQIVWSQNGHILDALMHFKNNVLLHFQGQVECAICYSIVSASEGSLPKKPCKTCKNRFHSSCLYKWFETSHSSSCPLCRSDIL